MLTEASHRNLSNKAVMGDEGVPSKAIWDPSLSVSLSSASSLASTEDASVTSANDRLEGLEVYDIDPTAFSLARSASPTEAFASAIESLPSAAQSESDLDLRMKIYEVDTSGSGGIDEENPMAANFRKTISSAHGSSVQGSNGSSVQGSSVHGSNCTSNYTAKSEMKNQMFNSDRDERQKFIDSMGNLNDKQLRIQLWDSFRLARVILGEPVKDKRRLSHKSILHSIRKVAELKLQNDRMLKKLDDYRQQEKKQKKSRKRQDLQSPDKENEGSRQGLGPHHDKNILQEPTQKSQKPPGLSSRSSSSTPPPLYQSPARIPLSPSKIVDESESPEAAVANLQEEAIKFLKAERDQATAELKEMEQRKKDKPRLESPRLFRSPSLSSEEEDGFSYGSIESPAEILNNFQGIDSPPRVIEPDSPPIVAVGSKPVAIDDLEGEIRQVLERYVGLEGTSTMHKDVISLLSRLLGEPIPDFVADATEAEAQQSSEGEAKPSPVVEIPDEEDEEEHPEIAALRAQISAAREREADSIENLNYYKLQMEMMVGDVEVAKKQTTKNREKLQLERLRGYKKELDDLLQQEEQRAKDVEELDKELDQLADVCVKLEDREMNFQAKHEQHQSKLSEFRKISERHSDSFRTLMGSIDRGIREQSIIVFGEGAHEDYHETVPPPPSDRDAGGFPSESANHKRRIQQLEHLITKQNVELLRYRAKFKARGGRPKKLTNRIKWSSNKSIDDSK